MNTTAQSDKLEDFLRRKKNAEETKPIKEHWQEEEKNVPQLRIDAFGDSIDLVPVGTIFIGSFGRVDMISRKGDRVMLFLQKRGGEWAFLERATSVKEYPVTEELFKDVLRKLLQ